MHKRFKHLLVNFAPVHILLELITAIGKGLGDALIRWITCRSDFSLTNAHKMTEARSEPSPKTLNPKARNK